MPRTSKNVRTPNPPDHIQTGVDLVLKDNFTIRKAAERVNVPYPTLFRYVHKTRNNTSDEPISYKPNYGVNKVMTDKMESELKEYLVAAAKLNYGLTLYECRKLAYRMANENLIKYPKSWEKHQAAGVDWCKGFMKRHPLSLRKPEGCSYARNTCFNRHHVNTFFDNMEKVMQENPKLVDGSRIFNLDETGTTTHYIPERVIAETGQRQLNHATSDERGVNVTTCCIISAAGIFLPPAMIFPRVNFQSSMTKGAPAGTIGIAAGKGKKAWMDADHFITVLEHFIKNTNASVENPALLIMDNHSSHISIGALTLARQNGITILTLPPHTTHRTQPLDVGVFGPFNRYYNQAMRTFSMENPNKRVRIYDIASFVGYAHIHAMTPKNIQNSFRKCGIFPYDRNVFSDEEFAPSKVSENPHPQESETSSADKEKAADCDFSCSATPLSKNTIPLSKDTTPLSKDTTLLSKGTVPEPVAHCSSSLTASNIAALPSPLHSDGISPYQIRPLQQVSRADSGNKPRAATRKGKSMIATSSPIFKSLLADKEARTKKSASVYNKQSKSKRKLVTKDKGKLKLQKRPKRSLAVITSSSSETGDDEGLEENLAEILGDESDDEHSEHEEEIRLVDISIRVTGEVNEGDYYVTEFTTESGSTIYYACKVIEVKESSLVVHSMRRSEKTTRFAFCTIPDISNIAKEQLRYKLPPPLSGGQTKRQQGFLMFDVLIPDDDDLR